MAKPKSRQPSSFVLRRRGPTGEIDINALRGTEEDPTSTDATTPVSSSSGIPSLKIKPASAKKTLKSPSKKSKEKHKAIPSIDDAEFSTLTPPMMQALVKKKEPNPGKEPDPEEFDALQERFQGWVYSDFSSLFAMESFSSGTGSLCPMMKIQRSTALFEGKIVSFDVEARTGVLDIEGNEHPFADVRPAREIKKTGRDLSQLIGEEKRFTLWPGRPTKIELNDDDTPPSVLKLKIGRITDINPNRPREHCKVEAVGWLGQSTDQGFEIQVLDRANKRLIYTYFTYDDSPISPGFYVAYAELNPEDLQLECTGFQRLREANLEQIQTAKKRKQESKQRKQAKRRGRPFSSYEEPNLHLVRWRSEARPSDMEVKFKIYALPAGFEDFVAGEPTTIEAEGQQVSLTFDQAQLDLLRDAPSQHPYWVAQFKGSLGRVTAAGMDLLEPTLQIQERSPDPNET